MGGSNLRRGGKNSLGAHSLVEEEEDRHGK